MFDTECCSLVAVVGVLWRMLVCDGERWCLMADVGVSWEM